MSKDADKSEHLVHVPECLDAPTTSTSKLAANVQQLNDLEGLERTSSAYISQGHVDPCPGYMEM